MMSPFIAYLSCHLWDMVDEGIDAVLDRTQGEAGVQGISVATSCRRIDQWRPHPGCEKGSSHPRRFISEGGAQFQPDASRYAATRIRPVPAEWLRKSNPLQQVAEACAQRKLALRARHVCCHSGVTTARYAHAVARDVFGQPLRPWLCPANPDVREFLRGCVEDLSQNYPFESIELEQFGCPVGGHARSHREMGVPLGPVGEWLSSLCFCESCRQMATRDGVDIAAVVSIAAHTLEGILDAAPPKHEDPASFIADRAPLAAFVDWRCRQITSLLELLHRSCRCRLVIRDGNDRFGAAQDMATLVEHVDAVLLPWYDADPTQLPAAVQPVLRHVGEPARVELGLSACTPPTTEAGTLVAAMKQAVDLGIRRFTIDNYGLMPLARLDWIRQACRYAQREAQ